MNSAYIPQVQAAHDTAKYDPANSYQWNYEHAPKEPTVLEVPQSTGGWNFCNLAVGSPIGIAAGPLLNGRWILHYAAIGFDVLTYKTVRSQARSCYELPNLQPVESTPMFAPERNRQAVESMRDSWAISFGMPSKSPDVWRADVEWTRARLPKSKILVVSVVASPQADWGVDELANDFATCARWSKESGADAVELNFSCPNVSTQDGQLYQQPEQARIVAQRAREAVGSTPLIIKVGFVATAHAAEQLLDALAPSVTALNMTNSISATIVDSAGKNLFAGQARGIGGEAIRAASIEQVRRFHQAILQRGYATQLIGVGGIFNSDHVEEYLQAGASSIQLATAAMLDPGVGIRLRDAIHLNRRLRVAKQ